mmetsp:Transcript_120026/g.208442  ORF Transcript_120026/g.208442 Transcript_120026/m.208442 type:complete len:135 (+) Transcript_120026:67-471(+)
MSAVARAGFKSLPFSHKMIYISAVANVSIVGFVWTKRQIKLGQQELKEEDQMKELHQEMSAGVWSSSNRFKCFFAAQRYHLLDTAGPAEEQSADCQQVLRILDQCRDDLHGMIPAETPAMRPLHSPPQYATGTN